ncbi:hypothetical protein HY469_00630 [Candidatus Roizmanbacteria bacterium]|nr:hypothetical protein [Candidatus Roizmanbacteria bacterium]
MSGELLLPSPQNVAEFIDARLGVEGARYTSPLDLARIGAAVYASDEFELHVEMSERYIAEFYALLKRKFRHFDADYSAFSVRYREMIGEGDYRSGTIAQALLEAPAQLSETEYERLVASLGTNYAEALSLIPGEFAHVPEPSVRMYPREKRMTFWGNYSYPMPFWPDFVVEYGPGIAGARRMNREMLATPQTVLIEKGDYKNAILASYGRRKGLVYPQLITRKDGIISATRELLQAGGSDRVDMVIAGNIHRAGPEEVRAGIRHGYQLLHPEGLLVMTGPTRVTGNAVDIDSMIDEAAKLFGNDPQYEVEALTITETTGEIKPSKGVIFEK